jgi:hypothetical protein
MPIRAHPEVPGGEMMLSVVKLNRRGLSVWATSIVCLFACAAVGTLVAQTAPQSAAAPSKARILEGFPNSEIQKLNNRSSGLHYSLGSHAGAAQSVITRLQVWNKSEMPLTVAFLGGSNELRAQIVNAVQAWTNGSGVSFDFGPPGNYHEWTRQDRDYQARIRISFDEAGYWSWVGAQSIDPAIAAPNEPSMNFEGFTQELPPDWQGVVLHEFGHSLGFEHEHQSPISGCDQQFRWNDDPSYIRSTDMYGQVVPDAAGHRPGIYSVLEGPPNRWKQPQIDFNLRQLPATTDLRFTAFDATSIMMYSFPDWMFVSGAQSTCYTAENLTLSVVDRQTVSATYPVGPTPHPAAEGYAAAARKLLQHGKLPADVQAVLQKRLSAIQ